LNIQEKPERQILNHREFFAVILPSSLRINNISLNSTFHRHILKTMETKGNLIAGKWRESDNTYRLNNPFSGESLADISVAGKAQIEETIAAARSASDNLKEMPRFRISECLLKMARGIEARKEEFARTIASEAAKPIRIARGEAERAMRTFEWAAEEARRFAGEVVPVDTQPSGSGKTAYTLMIPRGVIFGISPFNFPLNLVAHKVAPALASGNSIILKPSPRTPLTAILLGEVFLSACNESGFPKSALQVIQMDVADIDAVLRDDRVAMLSFTGSAQVGWELKTRAGKKPVVLELGGNASVIIDETVDWKKSLDAAAASAFVYAGQVCISAQRFYIHESIFDDWAGEFTARAGALKKGDPLDEDTALSVMIDRAAAERAESWVKEATGNGAKLLCGGSRSAENAAVMEATVLTGTTPEMRVVSEEVFAPVAVVEKFGDFAEAIDAANNSKYGLQAGVFTNDLSRARRAARQLEYGGVLINEMPHFRVDNMPYGGVKDSGFGREGVRYAMKEMCETRLVVIGE
jgi:acyl-CoA reductase-like NAD-dependent aldehyde dehydrogenase